MEFKLQAIDDVELKFADSKPGVFSGYASKFNGLDSYGDTIAPGAYAKTLRNRKQNPILLRWSHWGPVIGKWTALEEDDVGLKVEGELTPGHSVASDVYASLKHGAVNGLSIGFRLPENGFEMDGHVRVLKRIDLVEISIVETPADLGARVGDVKSAIDDAMTLKEIEALLRDTGRFSRADATALVARVKAISRGERDEETRTSSEIAAQIRAVTNRLTKGK